MVTLPRAFTPVNRGGAATMQTQDARNKSRARAHLNPFRPHVNETAPIVV